jgi:hypothetical protein
MKFDQDIDMAIKAVILAIDSAAEDLSDPDSNLFTANRLLAINHEGGYFELANIIPRLKRLLCD